MFHFGSRIRDLLGEDSSENDSLDNERISSSESDEDDAFDLFDILDSDDSSVSFDEIDDDDKMFDADDDDNYSFTFGDTITKALVLWAVKFGISHTALTALLIILRRFGHLELPKLARTLLHTPRKAVKPRSCPPGQFFYRGIQYYMDQYNDKFLTEGDTVEIDFFTDGLSLSDSSKVKMWPIMGAFVNQPTVHPFVAGCYSGNADPADPNDFMREFVDEVKELQENGIFVTKDQIKKKFYFRLFIGDAPACALATGTMSHSSYFGCPKCDQVCCGEGHKLFYQFFSGELRTDESFSQRKDILHHRPEFQDNRLLLEDVIGMVSQFVIEAMHAIDHGVTKRVVKAVLNNQIHCSQISKTQVSAMNSRFLSFRNHVPSEFVRKPRSFKELSGFKAAEFRQMILYTIPVLLKHIVSTALLNQILKLHVAVRLMSDPYKYSDNIGAARVLINEFVDQYDSTIGKENFTFYTHCLLHIPDCVKKYGSLYSWSGYKYENEMRIIARLLRRPHGHIQQFFNRIEELRYANELDSSGENRSKSKFNEFNLKPCSLRDGCCMVEPGYPVDISNCFVRNGSEYITGFRYTICEDFYDEPLPSMANMGILLASKLSEIEEEFLVTSIIHKFFRLPFEDKFKKMERLVLNKWTLPVCSTSNTTSELSPYKKSDLQQTTLSHPNPSQPKEKGDDNSLKENVNTVPSTVKNHEFAIPFGVQCTKKLIKPNSSFTTINNCNSGRNKYANQSIGPRIRPAILKNSKICLIKDPQMKNIVHPSASVFDKKMKCPPVPVNVRIKSQPVVPSSEQLKINPLIKPMIKSQRSVVSNSDSTATNCNSDINKFAHQSFGAMKPRVRPAILKNSKSCLIKGPQIKNIVHQESASSQHQPSTKKIECPPVPTNVRQKAHPITHSRDEFIIIGEDKQNNVPKANSMIHSSVGSIKTREPRATAKSLIHQSKNRAASVNTTSLEQENFESNLESPMAQSSFERDDLSKPSQKLVMTSLKALKGKPWTSFLKKPDNRSQLPTSNVPSQAILKIGETKKQIVKIPSTWKLVPIKMNTNSRKIGTNESSRTTASPSKIPIDAISVVSSANSWNTNTSSCNTPSTSNIPSINDVDLDDSWTKTMDISSTASAGQQNTLSIGCPPNSTDNGESSSKKMRMSSDEDIDADKFDIIMDKLNEMSKKEAKNGAILKAIVRKIKEDENTEEFSFPLREQVDNEKLEECISKKQFTDKLVASLRKRIRHSLRDERVSDLVESIYHPKLLSLYTVHGYQKKLRFDKLKMNGVFLDLAKMEPKEYYSDLAKVMNKMRQRHARHHHEY